MNILIADDMPMQVHMLENHLHATRPNDVLQTAFSGTEALRIIQTTPIDLVLSDIRMPGMDGLSLLKQIRTISPYTRVVFITAYALFEYAHEALRQGATDFLLKPVDFIELDDKMAAWEQTIQREKEETQRQLDQKRQLALAHWASEPYENLTEAEKSLLNKYISSGWMLEYCFCADADCPADALVSDLNAFLGQKCIRLSQNRNAQHRGLLLLFGAKNIEQALLNMLRSRSSVCEMRLGLSFRQDNPTENGAQMRLQCQRAVNLAFYKEESVMQSDGNEYTSLPSFPSPEEFLRICSSSEAMYADSVRMTISDLRHSQPDVSQLLEHTVLCFARSAEQTGIPFDEARRTLAASLRSVQRWSAYEQIFRQYADKLRAVLFANQTDPVQSCIQYLQRNYARPLSLNDMAQRAHMTPSYFSSLFKKRSGSGFVEYLTEIRLQAAAEDLLLHREITVNAVALRCGYTDARYFVRQFQKRFGMTPTAYRRRNPEREKL